MKPGLLTGLLLAFLLAQPALANPIRANTPGTGVFQRSGLLVGVIADQKAREDVVPKEGHEEGTEGAFAWARVTKPIAAPDLEGPGRPPRWHVYEINVQVAWGEQRRTVSVSTLRTISEAAQQEEARRP